MTKTNTLVMGIRLCICVFQDAQIDYLDNCLEINSGNFGATTKHCASVAFPVSQSVDSNNSKYVICTHKIWYAGIAVPQVLQYLREFDAPAMQSCKPLPCGTSS